MFLKARSKNLTGLCGWLTRTLEDSATRLHGAEMFFYIQAPNGGLHLSLSGVNKNSQDLKKNL